MFLITKKSREECIINVVLFSRFIFLQKWLTPKYKLDQYLYVTPDKDKMGEEFRLIKLTQHLSKNKVKL